MGEDCLQVTSHHVESAHWTANDFSGKAVIPVVTPVPNLVGLELYVPAISTAVCGLESL